MFCQESFRNILFLWIIKQKIIFRMLQTPWKIIQIQTAFLLMSLLLLTKTVVRHLM